MADKNDIPGILHDALHLDGSPESIKRFYAVWAENYEKDTLDWHYAAPANALYLLERCHSPHLTFNNSDRQIEIMDAGCGTGLLGELLSAAGYQHFDGFDLSSDMVAIAEQRSIYRSLAGNVDLNQPVRDNWRQAYDCTICIGVFTPGHVAPEALSRLIDMTRPGGAIIVSTRVAYYQSENFQATSDALMQAGEIVLLDSLMDASYTDDEKAHYWLYARTAP